METDKFTKMDIALFAGLYTCLVAFLAACFYPGITTDLRAEIKDLIFYFGLGLGLTSAAKKAA